MNRDKQIEGMQNTLIKIAKQPIMIEGLEHWSDAIAEELYTAGYRKASDVAREIFEEIEENILGSHYLKSYEWNAEAYEDLKKKYTESEKEK